MLIHNNIPNINTYTSKISFGNKTEIPEQALTYLRKRKRKLHKGKNPDRSPKDLSNYNTERLEGIQNGIKIFEGLSFKQIAFFLSRAKEFVLQRGCNNMCSHCFTKAMPASHWKKQNLLTRMDFEDFKELCHGIEELNNRFGFKISGKPEWENYTTLFHDADSSMITLTDKSGKVYDYADLGKMLYSVTGKRVLFDTAGWNIQDTKTQARMEALVKKVMESDEYNFLEFNVSLNPFHSIYSMALKQEKAGHPETAKKLTEIYTDRMANVIYTFAPLIRKKNIIEDIPRLNFIIRAMPDNSGFAGQDEITLKALINLIYEKMKIQHETKISTLTNKNNITTGDLDNIFLQLKQEPGYIAIVGRATDILRGKKNPILQQQYEHNNPIIGVTDCTDGIILPNGDFYVTNWAETYPCFTLNFSKKGKPTPPVHPNLRPDPIPEELM